MPRGCFLVRAVKCASALVLVRMQLKMVIRTSRGEILGTIFRFLILPKTHSNQLCQVISLSEITDNSSTY